MTDGLSSQIDRLARIFKDNGTLAAFTGAGMSTESGISDYRSPGGLWQKYQPPQIHEFMRSADAQDRYWSFYEACLPSFEAAKPNEGHRVLARLHQMGRIRGVITQNIDGLHQRAGVPDQDVWELHGSIRESSCLECGQYTQLTKDLVLYYSKYEEIPRCPRCDGLMKPRTVSFGQPLNIQTRDGAIRLCMEADWLIIIGSSLLVQPAADMPLMTLKAGGRLVIINQEPTPLDYRAELVIRGSAGEVLAKAAEAAGI
jgi:NAD-dependent deacetylase